MLKKNEGHQVVTVLYGSFICVIVVNFQMGKKVFKDYLILYSLFLINFCGFLNGFGVSYVLPSFTKISFKSQVLQLV